MKNAKIAFVKTRNDLTSIKIRADQVAKAMDVPSLDTSDEAVNNCDVLIYVKYTDSPEILEERSRKGIIQIYDPIDNFKFKEIDKISGFLDGFVAVSKSHRILLENKYSLPVRDIPHHHANFNEKRIELKRDGLMLGYVGDKTHYKQVKFLEKHFANIHKDIKYYDLENSYLSFDIGYAYRNDKMKKIYNSSLKLLNFMSFGIPSVLNFEMGYSEVGNHGEHCLFVDSKKGLIESLEYLLNNYELRNEISEKAFLKARDYHISKIPRYYRNYLEDVFNLKV